MKGVLFSSDFVKDENGELKLLELNTDTAFIPPIIQNIDFSEFFEVLTVNEITQVEIIYKEFQLDFLNFTLEKINHQFPNMIINVHMEEPNTIFPIDIIDSPEKFILRMVYDESSIFDSEYAKNNIELFKLFVDNNESSSIGEFAYMSSDFNFDNIGVDIFNSFNLPDVVVKNNTTSYLNPLHFYKIGHSHLTNEERLTNMKNELLVNDVFIQKYYVNDPNSTKVNSIRSFHIMYGENLDIIDLVNYEIDSILEKPTSIDFNDEILVNKLDIKHYFEFTTNSLRGFSDGVLEGAKVIPANGEPVLIENVTVGDEFKSFIVAGSPDTDIVEEVRNWSYPGSELPSGSTQTTSTLVSKTKLKLVYNVISNISIANVDNDSLKISPYLYLLTYEIDTNQICYRTAFDMEVGKHKLFDNNGQLIDLDSITMEVLEGDNYTYRLDMEEADTFFLEGVNVNVKLLTHNCFVEGTEILTPDGKKNIEDIKIGDKVLSWDEEKDELVESIVNGTSQATAKDLVHISFDGNDLKVTKEHPFYVIDKGWIKAKDLIKGDICIDNKQNKLTIQKIVFYEDNVIVYNLIGVKPANTFFTNNVLVHNKACFSHNAMVEMWDGSKKEINNILIGDEIKSIKDGEIVKGIVTNKLTYPIKEMVPVMEINDFFVNPTHPYLHNGKWVNIREYEDGKLSMKYIENYHNLEIDGDMINGSEHNFIIDGIIFSGLGDNIELNNKFNRQKLEIYE